jgi:hypothetical protein
MVSRGRLDPRIRHRKMRATKNVTLALAAFAALPVLASPALRHARRHGAGVTLSARGTGEPSDASAQPTR